LLRFIRNKNSKKGRGDTSLKLRKNLGVFKALKLQEQFSGVLNKMTEEYAKYNVKKADASADLTKGARIDFGGIKIPFIKITQKHFEEVCSRFEKEEPRGGFYDMSLRLIESGHNTEGALLLNATWNIATFRYYAAKFDIDKFDRAISGLYTESKTDYLGLNFEKIDFRVLKGPGKTFYDNLQDRICRTYDSLAGIKGVDYTGATKIMHLFSPNLLIPWDQFIREKYLGKKRDSGRDYIVFLNKMQEKFSHLKPCDGRTLPKCIDEFNYLTISTPMVEKLREKNQERKEHNKRMRADPMHKKLREKYRG
jgi:hypothetical protein